MSEKWERSWSKLNSKHKKQLITQGLQNGLKQKEIANKLDVSEGTISHWIRKLEIDNRECNIELLGQSEHMKLHRSKQVEA